MFNLASRTALAFLAVFSATGCVVGGQRANGGGVCPAGETCSDQTPSGLNFLGATTTDSFGGTVGVTAVGGTQILTVLDGPASFDVTSSDFNVVSISAVSPPNIFMTGEAAGSALVRLDESATNDLLDQVSIDVAKLDKVTLLPSELSVIEPENTTWALLAGGTAPLMVRLEAANGERLVDESMTLKSPSGFPEREAWDRFAVSAPASGEVTFAITAGSQQFAATAPVVAAVDDIVSSTFVSAFNGDDKVEVLQSELLCFVGTSSGVMVAGATWKFTGSASLEFEPTSMAENMLTHTFRSCIVLRATEIGAATLTVDASGFSKTFAINVVKKMAGSAQHKVGVAAVRSLRTRSAGKRAGGI